MYADAHEVVMTVQVPNRELNVKCEDLLHLCSPMTPGEPWEGEMGF